VSISGYNVYQVLLAQIFLFQYFCNSYQQVYYALYTQVILSIFGCCLVFNEQGLTGVQEFFACPKLYMTLFFQFLLLELRNFIGRVLTKLVIRYYADLLDWYIEIEEKLAFEQFENMKQIFSIQ
jgi:hypothetical protein